MLCRAHCVPAGWSAHKPKVIPNLPSFPMEDKIFSRSSHGKALRVGMSSGNTARFRPRATAALLQTCLIRGPRTEVSEESLSWPWEGGKPRTNNNNHLCWKQNWMKPRYSWLTYYSLESTHTTLVIPSWYAISIYRNHLLLKLAEEDSNKKKSRNQLSFYSQLYYFKIPLKKIQAASLYYQGVQSRLNRAYLTTDCFSDQQRSRGK